MFENYLSSLIKGKKVNCQDTLKLLTNKQLSIKELYTELFQKSLYEVGRLWEFNHISVAVEHMATAITESLMNVIYATMAISENRGFKALISSSENEYHQIGAKMVSDIFELNGWDTWYLGANTPVNELIRLASQISPHVIGLSLSVYFHLPELKNMITIIKDNYPECPVIIGGQAFKHGNGYLFAKTFPNTYYIESLDHLENFIKDFNNDQKSIA
jgi:methanogenic corrinoid protein MtbC1